MTIKGSCSCGAVAYEISGAFTGAGNCHCSICRKVHGAAFATWAFVDASRFRWLSGQDLLGSYPSSPGRERLFCSRCSSPLAARHNGEVSEIVLASVDGDPGIRPAEHIFADSSPAWDESRDDLPRHGGWPPGMRG